MAMHTMKFAIFGKEFLPICRMQLFFENYTNDFSETWYVTISDSTPSPLQVSANFMEWFFYYGLKQPFYYKQFPRFTILNLIHSVSACHISNPESFDRFSNGPIIIFKFEIFEFKNVEF